MFTSVLRKHYNIINYYVIMLAIGATETKNYDLDTYKTYFFYLKSILNFRF